MAIKVYHGPSVTALGQAAFAGGRGRYRKYLEDRESERIQRELQERMQIRGLDYGRTAHLESLGERAREFNTDLAFRDLSERRRLSAAEQEALRNQMFRNQSAVLDSGLAAGRAILGANLQDELGRREDVRNVQAGTIQNQQTQDRQTQLFELEADLRRELQQNQFDLQKQQQQESFTEGQRRFNEQIRNDFAAVDQAEADGFLTPDEAEAARRQVSLQSAHIAKLPTAIPKDAPQAAEVVQQKTVPVEGSPGAFWVLKPDGGIDLKQAKPTPAAEPPVAYEDFAGRYEASFNQLMLGRGADESPPDQEAVLKHMQEMDGAYRSFIQSMPQGVPQPGGAAGAQGPPSMGGQAAPPPMGGQPGMGQQAMGGQGQLTPEMAQAIIANPLQADFSQAPPGPAKPYAIALQETQAILADPGKAMGGVKIRGHESMPELPQFTIEAFAYVSTFGNVPDDLESQRQFLAALPLDQRAHLLAALKTTSMSGLEGYPRPQSPEEARLVPPGAEYVAPDGSIRVRKG